MDPSWRGGSADDPDRVSRDGLSTFLIQDLGAKDPGSLSSAKLCTALRSSVCVQKRPSAISGSKNSLTKLGFPKSLVRISQDLCLWGNGLLGGRVPPKREEPGDFRCTEPVTLGGIGVPRAKEQKRSRERVAKEPGRWAEGACGGEELW